MGSRSLVRGRQESGSGSTLTASLTLAPRAGRERSGRARHGSWPHLVFACSLAAFAISSTALATNALRASGSDWTQFWLLASLAAATVFFGIRGRGEAVHDTATVFLVAEAVVLPLGFAPFVALPACLLAVLWQRVSTLLVLHRTVAASVATVGAAAIAHAGPESAGGSRVAVLAVAGLTYCAITRGLDATYVRLAPDVQPSLRASGSPAVELVLAALGIVVASLWRSNPWVIPLALTPLILVRRLQQLPALAHQAETDAKTGLMNMHAFGGALESALSRAREERRPLSLVVIDLDLLREINNTHGHLVGDAVIRGISQVLLRVIRQNDLAARFGGEEFLLALVGTPPDRAVRIAERIREAVAARVFRGEPGRPAVRATLSAGVATYPRDATTVRGLIHAGDLAVMAAKARGRNRVVDAGELRRRTALTRENGRRRD
jgi:diguanylate cyclase (GGDEF)-like protein